MPEPIGSTGPQPENQTAPTGRSHEEQDQPLIPSSIDAGYEKPAVEFGGIKPQYAIDEGILDPEAPDDLGQPLKFPIDPSRRTESFEPINTLPPTEQETPVEIIPKKKAPWKVLGVGTLAAALATTAAVFGVKAVKGSDEPGLQSEPVATASASPGNTLATQPPTPRETIEPSTNPSASISKEVETGINKMRADREPFHDKGYLTAPAFAGMVADEATRELYSTKYKYTLLSPETYPNKDTFTDAGENAMLTENILSTQKEAQAVIDDGSLEKMITASNRLYGTDYVLDDFFIKEAPAAGASRAEIQKYVADMVEITYRFQALIVAAKRVENTSTGGTDTEKPLSLKLIDMSHLAREDRQELTDINSRILSDERIASNLQYTPGTVADKSAYLVSNFDRANQGGALIDKKSDIAPGIKPIIVPLLGTVSTRSKTEITAHEGELPRATLDRAMVYTYHTLIPVKVGGETMNIPVLLSEKRLASE